MALLGLRASYTFKHVLILICIVLDLSFNSAIDSSPEKIQVLALLGTQLIVRIIMLFCILAAVRKHGAYSKECIRSYMLVQSVPNAHLRPLHSNCLCIVCLDVEHFRLQVRSAGCALFAFQAAGDPLPRQLPVDAGHPSHASGQWKAVVVTVTEVETFMCGTKTQSSMRCLRLLCISPLYLSFRSPCSVIRM